MRRAVVLLGAVVLAGCGSSQTKTVTATATATSSTPTAPLTTLSSSATSSSPGTTTTTTTAAPPNTVHVATFKSPSGNIGCMIIAGTARCDIKQRSWSPPPAPKSCPPIVNYGQGMIVTASGPGHLVCAGDTTLDPTAQAVPYGTDTVIDTFLCESRSNGMTCTNTTTGHGFFIAIQGYRGF
jgi:hypothetical protein